MPGMTVSLGNLSLERLLQAVEESRKEMAKSIRDILREGRNFAKDRIRSQFRRRTGTLFRAASGMKVSATVSRARINGTVTPKPKLLNIYEHGATIPSQTIEPTKGVALRFKGRREGKKRAVDVFVRGKVTIPARRLAARPVIEPTRALVERSVGTDLVQTVDDILTRELTR